MTDQEPMINEYKLTDLIDLLSFVQSIYYLWTGRMPSKDQEGILESIFISLIDNGPETPSSLEAIKASEEGKELHECIAQGILATGKNHGTLPIKESFELYQSAISKNLSPEQLVTDYLNNDKIIPGYGHRVYTEDPRTQAILK